MNDWLAILFSLVCGALGAYLRALILDVADAVGEWLQARRVA
jgi:hypothetical protein